MKRAAPSPAGTSGSSFVISAVEQLDEVNRNEGWSEIEYRQLEPGRLTSSFARGETDTGSHTLEKHNRRFEVHCAPPPGMVAVFLIDGGEAKANGLNVGRDDVFLVMPGAEVHAVIPPALEVGTLLVPGTVLEATARHVKRRELPSTASDTTALRGTRQAMQALRRAHRELVLEGSRPGVPEEETSAAILTEVTKLMRGRGVAPAPSPSRHRGLRALATAREYIEAHLGEPVRMATVCEQAGVDLRSLERYFAREMGMSPKRYLLARRLNAARRKLVAADPEQVGVTDVALDAGFTHLGRFAGRYRSHFGESPRETLRNV